MERGRRLVTTRSWRTRDQRGLFRVHPSPFLASPRLLASSLTLALTLTGTHSRTCPVRLRTHFAVSAAWYVMRGNHAPPIEELYEGTDERLFVSANAGDGASL